MRGPLVLSSARLGFHPAAAEHRVVRLFEDWNKRQRCEVYGLRSGGWRPCAGQPPVFVDGCFYWYMNTQRNLLYGAEFFDALEPILSFSVDTEQFAWVARRSEERVPSLTARCARWSTLALSQRYDRALDPVLELVSVVKTPKR